MAVVNYYQLVGKAEEGVFSSDDPEIIKHAGCAAELRNELRCENKNFDFYI